MEVRITGRGAEVPIAGASPAITRLVRNDLCVAPISLNDPFPKKFKVYLETPDALVVPLHWARTALEPFGARFTDCRGPGQDAPLHFNGSLRADLSQHEAVEGVQRSWDACGGAMLCLPVGFGKTTCALYLAALVRKKTLVLVHKSFLKDQWAERVGQYLPGAKVTFVQAQECDTSGDVVVAMIQTLISRKYPVTTFASFGLTIVDEVHHLGAQAFSQSMWGLCTARILGLSATPERKDGLARVVGWFTGPIAFRMRREGQTSTHVRVVKYTCAEFEQPPPVNRRGDVCFTTVVTRLAENRHRTAAIAAEVHALFEAGWDVLVLTHRRQHAIDLATAACALGAEAATYLGGDKCAPDAKVIVATYALTSEGFDMPRLNALVLATPASDVEQSCGRVMRGSSTKGALIVDWVDQWGVCFAQHAKRRALYTRCGFTLGGDAHEAPNVQATAPDSFAFLDD